MSNEKTEELGRELESLKKDIECLQKDLGEMLSSAGMYTKEQLHQTRKKLHSAMEDLESLARERYYNARDAAKEYSHEAIDTGRKTVQRHPLTSILTAFLAGAMLSKLLGLGKS